MSVHLQRELDALKKAVLSLCALVEQQAAQSVQALLQRDDNLAQSLVESDREVDRREVAIEEECLKILALYQPVAIDLRYLVAILKINSDLERIGDLTVNIARKALAFAALPPMTIPFDLAYMGQCAQSMLHDSISAMIDMDSDLADDVCGRDHEVDCMKHDIRRQAQDLIRENPQPVEAMLLLMAVSRNLERIADHATNIAEDVIYLVEGRIVRHGH